VEAIETFFADHTVEQVERLAHHALRGEVWDKALAYCRQAGEKALVRSAYREAVGYFEQALSTLPHLPELRDTREQAIDLRLALRSALMPSGIFGRVLVYLREAETLAAVLDDSRRLEQVSVLLSGHFWLMGAHNQAIAAAQRALALAMARGDVVLHALANLYIGRAFQAQGDYRQAIESLRQTVASLNGVGRHEGLGLAFRPAVTSRAHLAWCYAELGMFAEGSALGEEGLRIAEAVAHPGSLMYASWGIGLLCLRQGDLRKALPMLERAVGICHEADIPFYLPEIAAALGTAYTLAERVADAMPLLTQALEKATVMETEGRPVLCSLPLGEAHLLAGRPEEAHALALAEELGMRSLVAHCHRGLGMLYLKTGRGAQARPELSAAIDMYHTMEMAFWLPQTEAALAQVEER
jgi:tetratricopeptide (TPR) repeat protein